ncbi:MAG: ABC transporter permease [Lachnospiraceae bacterium]|nr:ABC transporter permease [Lachnospiraceae bacterium]
MKYFVKKVITLIGTLILVSFLAFFLFQIVPGDPVTSMLGTEYTSERADSLRKELGIDKPILSRYGYWLRDFVRGDFGISYKYKMPVERLIGDKIPVTMYLAVLTLFLIIIISVPMSVILAKVSKKKIAKGFDIFNQSVMAVPSFFLGIIIIIVFGLILKWFTPGAYVDYRDNFAGFIVYIIPAAFAVAIPKIAMMVKFLKNSLVNELQSDYVRTAYSKGAGELRVLFVHVLRNGLMPAITLLGIILAEIMAGSIVVEQVFNLPGLGSILVSSVSNRDYPVVQTIVVYIACLVIVSNCVVDILYHIIDPRVRG